MARRAGGSLGFARGALRTAALAALALVVPASAQAAVITFDGLTPAPPPPGGHGTPVNSQFADQGVTFNNPEAFTYPPGFTHSPNVDIEPCFGVEFCQVPMRVDFTAPQDQVGIWVGFSGPLGASERVRLDAFDSQGNLVGSSPYATLSPSPQKIPIQTHLVVNPPGYTVTRVELTTESGYIGGLAADDLEYTDVGPPPPCNASGPPSVGISTPFDGSTVQNNSFVLQGFVDNNGGEITSATIARNTPSPRTASIFPVLIGPGGGSLGPISTNEFLAPGNNDVRVTATNCAGTGNSATRHVNYSPIPAGTRLQQFGQIEVNQTVQNTFDSVPLIANGPTTSKRTIARVYLGVTGTPAITGLTGTLEATLPDGSRAPGPAQVSSLNTVTVNSSNTADSTRAKLANSLNFELPSEWLAAGRIHLQLAHLYVEGAENHFPCDGCENPFSGGVAPASYRFFSVPPVRIWLVRVPYTPSAGAAQVVPSQNDIDMIASWLRRAYPTAEVRDTQMFMPVQGDHPEVRDGNNKVISAGFICNDINSRLSEWASSMQAQPANTRYYGVVDDNGGTMFMRGCAADIPSTYASGPSGNPQTVGFGWDKDSTYGDWYAGHEIGHMYGRAHPGYCNNNNDDSFPYGGGFIGGSLDRSGTLEDNQGFDIGNTSLGLAQSLFDWRTGASDVMTYCSNEWMSPYTYTGILSNLCNNEKGNCPDHSELSATVAAAGERRAVTVGAGSRHKNAPQLTVNGTLSLNPDRLDLDPMTVLRGPRPTERPKHSAYSIVLEGAHGKTLADYPFAPGFNTDPLPGERDAVVHEVLPFVSGIERIVVKHSGRTLASVAVSHHAPGVTLTKPKPGAKLGDTALVAWRAGDVDGGRLSYSLLYAADGKHFLPVAAGLRKSHYTVDLSTLPGGPKARFRVIATDGVLTGIATSQKPSSVAFKAPHVTIASPQPDSAFTEGDQIQFSADVEDIQSQSLPPQDIVWRSSIQGVIGTGASISAALQPGTHEISVTATNRGGKSATATLTLDVAQIPPAFDASAAGP